MDPTARQPSPAPTNLAAPRYCSRPFPPYRYVPGLYPHPTAHPVGHSYQPPGAPHPPATWQPPERWTESVEYLYGCDLYNHAYWWEAHEAWEALWQLTDKRGTQGRFLQGLIQAAACHLKLHTGHAAGVERLRTGSAGYLRSVLDETSDPVFMGLDVRAFIMRFESYYSALSAYPPEDRRHDGCTYPYLVLCGP